MIGYLHLEPAGWWLQLEGSEESGIQQQLEVAQPAQVMEPALSVLSLSTHAVVWTGWHLA